MFHLESKMAVSLTSLSLLPRSTTTTARRATPGCISGAWGDTEERGALGVASETRGFSLTLEGALASRAFARKVVRTLISGSPPITSRTVEMDRRLYHTEKGVAQR